MAGQNTGFQMAYEIDSTNANTNSKNEVPRYRIVEQVASKSTIKLAGANAIPLGVTSNDERLDDPLRDGGSQAGRNIAVQLDRIASVELSANVAAGGRVITAVGGKGAPIGAVEGTSYNVVGFAEKAGVDGDIIPVRLAYHIVYIPVTEV